MYQEDELWRVPPFCEQDAEFSVPNGNACIMRRLNCDVSDFYSCLAALERRGLSGGADYRIEQNRYVLRHGGGWTVYLSYSAPAGEVTLYREPFGENAYPAYAAASAEGVPPTLWQLPCDCEGAKQNGGMSYVLHTGVGHFAVIDGGYYTPLEAERLYAHLRAHTPQGQEPVIDAWFLSHLHWDHFGGMYAFSERYADRVPVKAFYGQFDYTGHAARHKDSFYEATHRGLWCQAAHYTHLHTGMEWLWGSFHVQVLFTLEELYPSTAEQYDFNNTSTVLMLSAAGQRILLLGDVMAEGDAWMCSHLPPTSVKSDIVQYSHHGYEGASQALYDRIAAPCVLWPLNVDGYQENYPTVPQNVFGIWHGKTVCGKSYRLPNRYICYEADYVGEILLPYRVWELTLPHTPSKDRLPDHEAIFQSKAKRDKA